MAKAKELTPKQLESLSDAELEHYLRTGRPPERFQAQSSQIEQVHSSSIFKRSEEAKKRQQALEWAARTKTEPKQISPEEAAKTATTEGGIEEGKLVRTEEEKKRQQTLEKAARTKVELQPKKSKEKTTVQNLIDQGKNQKARQLWIDKHSNQQRAGYGYCNGTSGDPVCGSLTNFCNSSLGGSSQTDGPYTCYTQPPGPGITISEEWARGVPMSEWQKKQWRRMLSNARSGRAGLPEMPMLEEKTGLDLGGMTASPLMAAALKEHSDEELKGMAKEFIREEGYFDPSTFQGYIKYKYVRNHPQKAKEKAKGGFKDPLTAVAEGRKDWDHYKASVAHPGHLYARPEIFSPAANPFRPKHHEHVPGMTTAWSAEQAAEDLVDFSPRTASKAQAWEAGRNYDILFNSNDCVGKTQHMCLVHWADKVGPGVAPGSQSKLKQRVNDLYDFSTVEVGYTASAGLPIAHKSEQWVKNNKPEAYRLWLKQKRQNKDKGLGYARIPDYWSNILVPWAENNPGEAGNIYRDVHGVEVKDLTDEKVFGGKPPEYSGEPIPMGGFTGATPQMLGGTTQEAGQQAAITGTEGQGLMETMKANPLLVAGGLGALVWFFVK